MYCHPLEGGDPMKLIIMDSRPHGNDKSQDFTMSRHPIEDEILLKCIKETTFAEQSDLQTALKNKGIEMPQATLSRRLKKLNVAKVNGVYQIVKQNTSAPVTRITQLPPNLIVINTLPGHAHSVAYIIDDEFVNEQIFGISGTIAGDDTIFMAVDGKQLNNAYEHLKDFFLTEK